MSVGFPSGTRKTGWSYHILDVLNITELFTLVWLTLHFVTFTLIKLKNHKINESKT
jgi:hypothetical protein